MTKSRILEIKKENVFKKIDKTQITKDVKEAIKKVSYIPKNYHIYGSFSLAAQSYPSDIDGFEEINLCDNCDYEEAMEKGAQIIQTIVRKIKKSKNCYLGDIKVCKDEEQSTDLKKIVNNPPSKKDFEKLFKNFLEKEYISEEQYEKLILLNQKKKRNLAEIYEILRNMFLLRWNQEEILRGYKELEGKRIIKLKDALKNCKHYDPIFKIWVLSIVKIDILVKLNGKFREVTNLLQFYYTDKKSKKEYVSFSKSPKEEFIESLQGEIASYYYNPLPKYKNPIKYAKRIFTLASIYNDVKTGEKLVKLWRSPYNILYALKSEIGTLIDIMKKVKKPRYKEIIKQIEEMKFRLSRIIDINIPIELFDYINNIIKKRSNSKIFIIENLEKMNDIIRELTNNDVIKYLKSVNLYPAPKNYLDKKNFYYYY